ncbi:glycoside hydrolase family 99-like domain-containing protein [Aminobacter aminovorans]|uniref:glycosyltransferase WbsX family protein n=1 Tax=Aminobacter aminovorans TaxID=83263 RepID=UPI002860BB72|nr:glycoside hydrolase family 99-like domain-containing protein [Aminobacter aminovorans]MDR7221367.1 lipopolysaccharide biosynthesis protein [Aminobacter aminovorans]
MLRRIAQPTRWLAKAQPADRLYDAHVGNLLGHYPAGDYKPIASEAPAKTDVRLVAYYLPQFHPTAENDAWWGKGFTEWRNVARAFPVFDGHYQPRLPGELGYYDLRLPEIMRRQVELAKLYGISAFCFHLYWFGGRRLLEDPLDHYLATADLDLPFCLCWANETWSRRWSGREQDVLLAQRHSAEDDVAVIRGLDKYFRDPRYLKIDGKPVFTIYRASLFPDLKATIARWRAEMATLGYPGIYLIATNAFDFVGHEDVGFDALSEFPPHGIRTPNVESDMAVAPIKKGGRIRRYPDVVATEAAKRMGSGVIHPGVMPSWDNSARRPTSAQIYHGSTPALFEEWLGHAMKRAQANPANERLVFINAWNEWGEGAYLEPDLRYGYAYLDACAEALRNHR